MGDSKAGKIAAGRRHWTHVYETSIVRFENCYETLRLPWTSREEMICELADAYHSSMPFGLIGAMRQEKETAKLNPPAPANKPQWVIDKSSKKGAPARDAPRIVAKSAPVSPAPVESKEKDLPKTYAELKILSTAELKQLLDHSK